MTIALQKHQVEIQRNLDCWQRKPLLQAIYARFYERITALIDVSINGQIVEIGSGIGNLKSHLPEAIATDLFPNPWLDLICDGYELPFRDRTISHLILFDVFHHLEAPNAFLREARRVLVPKGRLILFEPYISWLSYPVYGLFHHEPVARNKPISFVDSFPRPRHYYAAQGNATRLFFKKNGDLWPQDWIVSHAVVFACFSYLFSGGFSKPALYPRAWLAPLQRCDQALSRWPDIFGSRCLVALSPRQG
jgi:SAM-dependent methyltransferase